MRVAPIEYINLADNRFRKEFKEDKIQSLADSIAKSGLINLPVCRHKEDGTLELIAGERRFRAIKTLHALGKPFRYMGMEVKKGEFPFAFIGDLPELEAREIELEENIERQDLTWQEVAIATAMLHDLRQKQNPQWTVRQTAEEIAGLREETVRPTTIQARITLAQHLDEPTIRSAKTERDAVKALYKTLEREFQQELGKRVVLTHRENYDIQLTGALEGILTIPSESVDCVITDPPYGVDADLFNADTAHKHAYEDDFESVNELMHDLFPEVRRVLKAKGHFYMFCDFGLFPVWKQLIEADTDLVVWPRPIIWVKDMGHIPKPHFGPQYRYECILFANKGERTTIHLDADVISVPVVKNKIHAAEKPVEVYVNLLSRTVYPGNTILDPFCGSGTVFIAASQVKCQAIGFDNDPACVQMSSVRIKEIKEGSGGDIR